LLLEEKEKLMVIIDFLDERVGLQQGMEVILLNQIEKIGHKEKTVGHLEMKINEDSANHLVDTQINLPEDDLMVNDEVDLLVHRDQDKKDIHKREESSLLFFYNLRFYLSKLN